MSDPSAKYTELARAEIRQGRNLVISQYSKGGFTVAQQIEIQEDKHTINVFLKGSTFHVANLDGLYNLRDALNVAISKIEEREKKG